MKRLICNLFHRQRWECGFTPNRKHPCLVRLGYVCGVCGRKWTV